LPYIINFYFLFVTSAASNLYFNLSLLFLIAALSFVGGRFLTSFIFCMGVCFIILTLWLGVLIVNTTPSTKNKKEFALIIFIIVLTLCSTVRRKQFAINIYFEMSLFFASTLNQLAIVVYRDRSDDESTPNSNTPLTGGPSKNSLTSDNISSSTHSDLRGWL